MSHTPGPWTLDRRSEKLVGANGANVVVYASGLSFAGLPPTEEFKANARLIAAAPELLEALKALRSFMWKEGYTDTTPAMVKADVAISNATGGAE
jgi:hypothetical protein